MKQRKKVARKSRKWHVEVGVELKADDVTAYSFNIRSPFEDLPGGNMSRKQIAKWLRDLADLVEHGDVGRGFTMPSGKK